MPIQTFNPMGELVQGLLNAHSIANQIKRAAMEKEQFEQQKIDTARRREAEDLHARMQLAQNARAIPASGLMSEDVPLNIPTEGLPDAVARAIPQSAPVVRKPDASRTVKYKTAGGEELQYELLSPEEQVQRRLDEVRATRSTQIAGDLDALRHGVGADARAKADRETKAEADAADRTTRLNIAQGNWDAATKQNDARIKAAGQRAADDRASREKIAKTTADSRTAAASIRANTPTKVNEAQESRLDADALDKLEKQRTDLSTRHATLSAQVKAGVFVDPKTGISLKLSPGQKQVMEAELAQTKEALDRVNKRIGARGKSGGGSGAADFTYNPRTGRLE